MMDSRVKMFMQLDLAWVKKKQYCQNLRMIPLILGAHVLGFTSNILKQSIGNKLKRITALDPALPFFAVAYTLPPIYIGNSSKYSFKYLFQTARPSWKLDYTDADWVDVIHTNAGIYGKLESCGHIDFYLNGQ